ncbi:hypothetical protein Tco_0973919 [Tanacetum coccineum]|uniref:Gag-Pol polyprotein n=1 Tax=Tanacetum coccineum TaxID=301880 RepID=A0ABQ5EA57_9ASTR
MARAHLLEKVIGDPTRPVMTQRKLATDAKMCMYALTLNTTKPKNIKEAMQDHSWIESIQEELYQFRIYNRKTRKIMEEIHVKFDELTAMASKHNSL